MTYFLCPGLLNQLLSAPIMERPALEVHRPQHQHHEAAGLRVGQDLGARRLLPQREVGRIPLGDDVQSPAAPQRQRRPVVCHQVSPLSHILRVIFFLLADFDVLSAQRF